jgi:origin recognition complex subunit 2
MFFFFCSVSVWDQARLSRYNFVWWDVTSLQPYTGETQFENSLLVHKSGGLQLSSLSNVFHSLTTNARSVFIIMVRHQLRNQKDPTYLGMKNETRSQQLDCRWA